MDAQTALLEQLAHKREGSSIAAQARELKLSQPYWSHVANGKRNLGKRTLNRIRVTYPDLAGSAIAVLLEGGN